MLIQKDLEIFLDNVLPLMDRIEENIATLDFVCCTCRSHHRIRFPIVARECDIKHFQELLEIADKYLQDKGATTKMLEELFAQIEKRLTYN